MFFRRGKAHTAWLDAAGTLADPSSRPTTVGYGHITRDGNILTVHRSGYIRGLHSLE